MQPLLQPPQSSLSIENALSVLNARFSTVLQIQGEDLAKAVTEAQQRAEQLQTELNASQNDFDGVLAQTRRDVNEMLKPSQELAISRYTLCDDVTSLIDELDQVPADDEHNDTEASSQQQTLLAEFESLHASLAELEYVRSYVQIVERALRFSKAASEELRQAAATPPISYKSVTRFVAFREFVASIERTCEPTQAAGQGQGVHLIAFLRRVLRRTWKNMKDILAAKLITAAEKLGWPSPVDYPSAQPDSRKEFASAFLDLLRLQDIANSLPNTDSEDGKSKAEGGGLYPIQVLTQPIAARFKYHFEGTRQTNKLEKPEWYFTWVVNMTHDHRNFMDGVIQPLLQPTGYAQINAWREFVNLLLPILSSKLRKTIPALLSYPSLLAHTIYQCFAFDVALRDAGFGLKLTSARVNSDKNDEEDWHGISEFVLGRPDWFDGWRRGEAKFAEDQYNEIVNAPTAWHLSENNDEDEDVPSSLTMHEQTPTNSARRIKALFKQITDRYKALPRTAHQLQFFLAVQLPILKSYHTRISTLLDESHKAFSSFLLRAVPGAFAGVAQAGLPGAGDGIRRTLSEETREKENFLQIVHAYVSAKWMADVIAGWGEDLFFLELWKATCLDPALHPLLTGEPLPGPKALGAADDTTIFDLLVRQYKSLADRADGIIVRIICDQVESALRPALLGHIPTPPEADLPSGTEWTAHLGPSVALFASYVSLASSSLCHTASMHLYRRAGAHIAQHVLARAILYAGRGWCSTSGGRVLQAGVALWVQASRGALTWNRSAAQLARPWARLEEGTRILALEGEAAGRLARAVDFEDDEGYKRIAEELEVEELERQEVREVVWAREDFTA